MDIGRAPDGKWEMGIGYGEQRTFTYKEDQQKNPSQTVHHHQSVISYV